MGYPGPQGPKGNPGQGLPGIAGNPGIPGPSAYLYVRHSQTTGVPQCPQGHSRLWSGYSFLQSEDEGRAFSQDLGLSGSCMQKFNPMPLLFCEIHDVCNYATRSLQSYWLATTEAVPMMPTRSQSMLRYISRCSVCTAPAPVLTIHGQSTTPPKCPAGWSELWTGFSFLMHAVGAMSGGQPLSSPGSCLELFYTNPFIECSGRGQCHFFSDKFSYWLMAQSELEQLEPQPETLKAGAHRNRISRCRVCVLDTPQPLS